MKILIDVNALIGHYSDNGPSLVSEDLDSLTPSVNAKVVLESLCKNHDVKIWGDDDLSTRAWLDKNELKYSGVLSKSNSVYSADLVLSPSISFLNSSMAEYRVCLDREDNKQWLSAKVGSLKTFEEVIVRPLEKLTYK